MDGNQTTTILFRDYYLMLKAETKPSTRVIKFTGLAQHGLPVDELDLFVSYQGHSDCRKGIANDVLIRWMVRVLNGAGADYPIEEDK